MFTIRRADANDTAGVSIYREPCGQLEKLIESVSWLPLVSVVPECQSVWGVLKSPSTSESDHVRKWSSGGE